MIRWKIPTKFQGKNEEGLTFEQFVIREIENLLSHLEQGRTYSYSIETKDGNSLFAPFNDDDIASIEKKYGIKSMSQIPGTDNVSFGLKCWYENLDSLVSPETAKSLKGRIKEYACRFEDVSILYYCLKSLNF